MQLSTFTPLIDEEFPIGAVTPIVIRPFSMPWLSYSGKRIT
jgi:hypothetical protein